MRYELSDDEWSVIKPMLPNKPRGIPRVDDPAHSQRHLFWVLRSGAPWRDLPESYGPHTTGPASRATKSNRWAVRKADLPARFTLSWTPMACQCASASRPVRRTTIGYVRYSSPDCAHERRCWQIEAMTLTGSGRSPVGRARGRTSRRNAIAKTRSPSALTSTEHVTWLSARSTRSSSVGVSRPAMTSSQPTTLRSSSLLLFGFGYAFMSPRPNLLRAGSLGASPRGARSFRARCRAWRLVPRPRYRDRDCRQRRRDRWHSRRAS